MSLNVNFNFKVFDSLKCTLCKTPFSSFANDQFSPRKLGCGLAMCNRCFEKVKAAKNQGRHRCDHGNCFHNTKPAHFLIDILSQDSLQLSRLTGHYLIKPFNIPKCPICRDKYSNETAGKKSFVLNCNHMICTKCYQVQEKKSAKINEWKFTIKCPTCEFVTKSDVYTRKDRFQNFLDELSKMNQQLEARSNLNYCIECQEQNAIDKMFYCPECSFEICGACAYTSHHSHKAFQLLDKKTKEMLEKLQCRSRNALKSCQDLFPELHKELLDNIKSFETRLIVKIEKLKEAPTLSYFQGKYESLTKLQTDFEAAGEKYLPHLLALDTKIKEMVKTLDEDPNV